MDQQKATRHDRLKEAVTKYRPISIAVVRFAYDMAMSWVGHHTR